MSNSKACETFKNKSFLTQGVELTFKTKESQEMIDITSEVSRALKHLRANNGLCSVFTPHATAAILINENWDPNIATDFFHALNKAIPRRAGYLHDRVDGNAQSHVLAALIGPQELIPVKDGRLALGRWQSVMLVELDGPRERRVLVTFTPSND